VRQDRTGAWRIWPRTRSELSIALLPFSVPFLVDALVLALLLFLLSRWTAIRLVSLLLRLMLRLGLGRLWFRPRRLMLSFLLLSLRGFAPSVLRLM